MATDGNGAFAVNLVPGDYILTAEPTSALPPSASGQRMAAATVHVAAGIVSHVTIAFDTGIR